MKRYIFISLFFAVIYGCGTQAPPPSEHPDVPPTFRGTVGSYCELFPDNPVRVQAYSLVLGLSGTGSSECPPTIKSYLVKQLRSLRDRGYLPNIYRQLTAEQIIASSSTAVVEVIGTVPARAPKGERLNVEVTVLEGTQTTSLQGGWLMPTDLRQVVGRYTGRPLARQPTARAAGPIFINPLPLSLVTGQKADPRRGIVLGGGQSTADRTIRLSLLRPDFRIAQQIQNRLNSRFEEPEGPKVAEATREYVNLRIPPSYRNRYNHFVSLVWALFLQNSPGFLDNKLSELQILAGQPGQDYETISLAWEAIGRPALGNLELLYREEGLGEVSFYAARTALNLGDPQAINVLITMAQDENHPSQLPAIQVLSENSSNVRSRSTLRRLIHDKNHQIRLWAYQGLRKTGDPSIRSVALSRDFGLEVVDSSGEKIIYIWAALDPRIIIFGEDLRCRQNIFFESQDEAVLINADADDRLLTITRRLAGGNEYMSLRSSFVVEDMIQTMARPWKSILDERPRAGGLNFSEIVGILYELCEKKVIPARFELHRVGGGPNPLAREGGKGKGE